MLLYLHVSTTGVELCSLQVHSTLVLQCSHLTAWLSNSGFLHSSRAWWAFDSFHIFNCWGLLAVHVYKYWAHLIAWSGLLFTCSFSSFIWNLDSFYLQSYLYSLWLNSSYITTSYNSMHSSPKQIRLAPRPVWSFMPLIPRCFRTAIFFHWSPVKHF